MQMRKAEIRSDAFIIDGYIPCLLPRCSLRREASQRLDSESYCDSYPIREAWNASSCAPNVLDPNERVVSMHKSAYSLIQLGSKHICFLHSNPLALAC